MTQAMTKARYAVASILHQDCSLGDRAETTHAGSIVRAASAAASRRIARAG